MATHFDSPSFESPSFEPPSDSQTEDQFDIQSDSHTNPDTPVPLSPEIVPSLPETKLSACKSFAPGHVTHWIQAKVPHRHEPVPAQIIEVSGHYITLMTNEDFQTYWHHDAARLAEINEIARSFPNELRWCPQKHLLTAYRSENGLQVGSTASLAPIDQIKPCATDTH